MSFLPDPLHPAVVHFPIVLLLLGAVAAVVAVFWRRGFLPWLAALLLVLGALGAWAAVESGEDSGSLLETVPPQMESLLDAHQAWAKRTLLAALLAAVAALASALLARRPRLARGLAVTTALVSLSASWSVLQTGHRGGMLVFRHGAGVQIAPTPSVAAPGTFALKPAPKQAGSD